MSGNLVTAGQVREMLADPKLFPNLPADFSDEAELTLDSLSLVWLLNEVEQRHGLIVELSDEVVDGFTSVRGIVDGLNQAAPAGRRP